MFGMRRLLLGIVIAAGSVTFGNATSVKPMHEWSYDKEADDHILRYYHEAWDNESTGFTIECHSPDKTALTIGYSVVDDKYFRAYKRKQLKPKLTIQSRQERLSTVGELDENSLFPSFVFTIPQSSSVEFLRILSNANAVMIFPNHSFKIWQIKKSSEIAKFLSACGGKSGSSSFGPKIFIARSMSGANHRN
jgi:hypothetical protein